MSLLHRLNARVAAAPELKGSKVLLDLGSYDGDSMKKMLELLPDAHCHLFECHPAHIPVCAARCAVEPRMTLVPKAVSNRDGPGAFYVIDSSKTHITTGASSTLKTIPTTHWGAKLPQTEVAVEFTRVDTWAAEHGIAAIDIVWMDLQGAEVRALEGFGALLRTVRIIHTEVIFDSIYEGQASFAELDEYLTSFGFEAVDWDGNRYPGHIWRGDDGQPLPWTDILYMRRG